MPIPQNKEVLLIAIRKDYKKLVAQFEKVPADKALLKTMPGHAKGTLMSPYDLAAYLVGWTELVLDWNKQISAGKVVDFPCPGFNWAQLGLLAQKFYLDYPDHDFSSILSLLDSRIKEIIKLIEQTDNDILYGTFWYKEYTMGRMIQLNTSSPFKNARKRLFLNYK